MEDYDKYFKELNKKKIDINKIEILDLKLNSENYLKIINEINNPNNKKNQVEKTSGVDLIFEKNKQDKITSQNNTNNENDKNPFASEINKISQTILQLDGR